MMPLISLVADAFSAVTLDLVILFIAMGLFFIAYMFFHSQIQSDSDSGSHIGSGTGACHQL